MNSKTYENHVGCILSEQHLSNPLNYNLGQWNEQSLAIEK